MKLSTEKNYAQAMSTYMETRWKQKEEGFFSGVDNKSLAYMSLCGFNQKSQAIVFISGRNESYLKYKELFWEFTENGYDVFSYDHRGQGLSERVTEDIEIGHVDNFYDYVDDLQIFMQQIVMPKKYRQLYLVMHSMGGLVGLLYSQRHPSSFTRIACFSPMLGIHLSIFNRKYALYLSKFLAKRANKPTYAPTVGPYKESAFRGNTLTSCRCRYDFFQELKRHHLKMRIGGPSSWWIYQSLKAGLDIQQQPLNIKVPVLLFQSGKDKVVDNKAQNEFIEHLKTVNCQVDFEFVAGAQHEIFFEADQYRIPAIRKLFHFLQYDGNSLK